MCPISLMCLMLYKFKLQNIFGHDKNNNKGDPGGVFFCFFFSCFLHVLCYFQHIFKHIRHIGNIGHMN